MLFGVEAHRLFVCVYMTELAKYHTKSELSLHSPPHKCIAQALCKLILVCKSHKNLHSISTLHIHACAKINEPKELPCEASRDATKISSNSSRSEDRLILDVESPNPMDIFRSKMRRKNSRRDMQYIYARSV
jgi:hypothetical protein